MPKIKIPRKSTNIDMTAMCDVAFLLLSFFILATKFKPPDALTVTTPKSVSTTQINTKNMVQIIMDKDAKVYFTVDDGNRSEKSDIIDFVDQQKSLGLTQAEKDNFIKHNYYIGVPFSQLKAYLDLSAEQVKNYKAPGLPVDTVDNQLFLWMRGAVTAFQGKKMNLTVKGDNDAKYPSFKGVIDAFKKNEVFKFSMITDPEAVPAGTELAKKRDAVGAKATDQ